MRVRRGAGRARRGGAAVEMAAVLPIFVALVFGQIEFSRLGMVSQMLTIAAREGCRVAILDGKALSDVQSAVTTSLSGTGIKAPTVQAINADPGTTGAFLTPSTWSSATSTPIGTPITLVIRVAYKDVSWLPHPTYLKSINVTGSASINSEHAPSS
jgi:Flp pilus assembly protein TadG